MPIISHFRLKHINKYVIYGSVRPLLLECLITTQLVDSKKFHFMQRMLNVIPTILNGSLIYFLLGTLLLLLFANVEVFEN